MNYYFINNLLLKDFTKFFPRTLNRKIFRNFNVFFVPTTLKKLPSNFYPITTDYYSQKNFVQKFYNQKKLINGTTKKNLDKFLFNIYKRKPFSFFDVGGDNIDLYLFLSHKLNIKKYYISNFSEIIYIFKKLKTEFHFNNFFPISNTINLKNIDFIYFGSCIQYFKNYKSYLNLIFKRRPKYILFSGTTFFYDDLNIDTYVVKQTNILPNTIFLYFFNYKNFIDYFNKNGYKLVSSKENKTTQINYKNFHPLLKKIKYLDLFFKKK